MGQNGSVRVAASPAFFCVFAAWLAMGLSMLVRHRAQRVPDVQRGRGWAWGFLVQCVSIGILWARPQPEPPGTLVSVAAVLLAWLSVGVIVAAQRTLGRQFAYQARLVEDHKLVTAGPYRYVRHPIYTALFGLALATGLVLARWPAIALFVPLYFAGTLVRIRIEERLLRARFGAAFEDYSRRVPALIPNSLLWCKL